MINASLLIVVPARGGSVRLPGKNLVQLAGKTLLEHTADAIASGGFDAPVLLTTDDEAIAGLGEKLGWTVPFRRPPQLATDTAATIDAVVHALDWWRDANGADPGAVMVLQPTSPLRGGMCLRSAMRLLESRGDVNSVVGMTSLHVPASHVYTRDETACVNSIAPDVDDAVCIPNGAVYLVRTPALRQAHTLYAPPILPLLMDPRRAIDIDTSADRDMAEALLAAGLPPDSEETPARSTGTA